MGLVRVVVITVLAVLAGCGKSDAGADRGPGYRGPGGQGGERGACYPNRTCKAGLLCLSDRCVRPPGADCDAVGQQLTSLELGNYAPKEERAKRVLALAAICRAQHMTKDEAACVMEKTTKDELRACPRPLIVAPLGPGERITPASGLTGACNDYVATLERYATCPAVPPDARKSLRQAIDAMKQNWSQLTGQMAGQINDACRQGMDAMRQAMKSMGCP